MSLRLEYPDKYRLWSELVKANTDRVFIEAGEGPRLGDKLPVELAVAGNVPLFMSNVVIMTLFPDRRLLRT